MAVSLGLTYLAGCFHLPWSSPSRVESLIPSVYLKPLHCPTPVTYWSTQLCLILECCLHLYPALAKGLCSLPWKTLDNEYMSERLHNTKACPGNVITQAHFQQGKGGCLGPSITQEQRWRAQGCESIRLGWVVLLPSISVGVPGLTQYRFLVSI